MSILVLIPAPLNTLMDSCHLGWRRGEDGLPGMDFCSWQKIIIIIIIIIIIVDMNSQTRLLTIKPGCLRTPFQSKAKLFKRCAPEEYLSRISLA